MIMHGEVSLDHAHDESFSNKRFIPSTWNNGMVE
jgi:hypothetical protein